MYVKMHELSVQKWRRETYICDYSYGMERSDFESRVKSMLRYDERDGDMTVEFRYLEGGNKCLVIYNELVEY